MNTAIKTTVPPPPPLTVDSAFNLNDFVSVKLTRAGVDFYYQHEAAFGLVTDGPKTDEDGWFRIQLWELMSIFGSQIHMTSEPMFETEIILHRAQ